MGWEPPYESRTTYRGMGALYGNRARASWTVLAKSSSPDAQPGHCNQQLLEAPGGLRLFQRVAAGDTLVHPGGEQLDGPVGRRPLAECGQQRAERLLVGQDPRNPLPSTQDVGGLLQPRGGP